MMPEDYFYGEFVNAISTIQQKLKQIKAFVFDWDGVFNDGRKDIEGHSSFSEVDSMGINMMRFSYFLLHGSLPVSIIFTGENNKLARSFARRENFHAVYSKAANKTRALEHACNAYSFKQEEVLFVFDDVLDFSVAAAAGVRCMIGRSANALLKKFATEKGLVDYITKHNGSNNAIREITELVMLLHNNFDATIEYRMHNSDTYENYLHLRKEITTTFFIIGQQSITEETAL